MATRASISLVALVVAMLAQFLPVKMVAKALGMSRGTVSERAKRAGMTRHYITDAETRLLLRNRIGGAQ